MVRAPRPSVGPQHRGGLCPALVQVKVAVRTSSTP